MHLSAPAGRSINDGIHPDKFSLHYSSVDDAVAILLHLGKGALMAKIDFKSAFQMIPVHCVDWDVLGMHMREQYYVVTCLPFGLRSAPVLLNEYSTAIEWIMTHNYQLCHLIHYLDDFFLAAPLQSFCCQHISPRGFQARCASSHGEGRGAPHGHVIPRPHSGLCETGDSPATTRMSLTDGAPDAKP